jgi:aminoglycoside phosphotransferase (APT) family kinase protein
VAREMTDGRPHCPVAEQTSPVPQPSRRLPLMPGRLDVWATPGHAGVAAARVLYQPRHRARRAARVIAQRLPVPSRGHFPSPDTYVVVEHIAQIMGLGATAAAALNLRGTDRWLYALTSADGRGVVAKVGKTHDEGLLREASTLAQLSAHQRTFPVPVLRWHGHQDGWFVLVTDIVKRRNGNDDAGLEDARAAACALATEHSRFVVHGDLAPWNMIPTASGVVLVDWEKSRFEHDPLCDLAHYVVRVGALLRRWQPPAAVRHLIGSESVGRRYLREIGLDPESASAHLRRYLERPTSRTATNSTIRRYELEMAEILESNST